jgi:hypothetical protein
MPDEVSDPQATRPPPTSLTAKHLYDAVEAYVTQVLADAKAGEHLTIEYHAPGGAVLHVTDVGYTGVDLFILSARDHQQQECQILVHKHALQLVIKLEQGGRPAQRRTIGFLGDRCQPAIQGSAEKSAAE